MPYRIDLSLHICYNCLSSKNSFHSLKDGNINPLIASKGTFSSNWRRLPFFGQFPILVERPLHRGLLERSWRRCRLHQREVRVLGWRGFPNPRLIQTQCGNSVDFWCRGGIYIITYIDRTISGRAANNDRISWGLLGIFRIASSIQARISILKNSQCYL